MEQLRQIGEAVGSIKAFMAFRGEIQINQRQCYLLSDAFNLAFDVIVEEVRRHLRYEEKQTKWQALENPLKELHRVIKEGEYYIKQCLDSKDCCPQAIRLNLNADCVEYYMHNLLWCLPIVLEAIENAAEISGGDDETIQWKRITVSKKYEQAWMEPKLFFHRFAKHYLVSQEMCDSFSSVGEIDRLLLTKMISEMKASKPLAKQESQIAELLLAPRDKVYPVSVLVGSKDYQEKRRLGSGAQYKEIQWMGESFAVYHCFGDFNSMSAEISVLTSVMHPNVMNYLHVFFDNEKKALFCLMELMSKNLSKYISEMSSTKRKILFPLPIAVEIMLQIARGMEYLHSKKVYHGELNPTNILLKSRDNSSDYTCVKISGFCQPSSKTSKQSPRSSNQTDKDCWYAPEVLAELDQMSPSKSRSSKFTEKADVYSFAIICFQLLSGKVPFEDDHLQGEKMSKNIRAGTRPLFPAAAPKFLTSLTKKCWQPDPSQRPSFSSICRVLRYAKRFLVMNPPDQGQPYLIAPPVDYVDIEMSLLNKFKRWTTEEAGFRVSEIPLQMFCYRVLERERSRMNVTERSSEPGSKRDEVGLQRATPEEASSTASGLSRSSSQPDIQEKSPVPEKLDLKARKFPGSFQPLRPV